MKLGFTYIGWWGSYLHHLTLNSTPRPDIKLNMQLVESCWVEIDPGNGKAPILIGSLYSHPCAKIEEFTKQLDDFIKKITE